MTKQFFPLLVALFMLLGGVQPVSALNVPEDVLEYNGDLFGLIDDTGREIIKAKYARIEYERNGVFVVTEVNNKNRVVGENAKRFFNYEGDELKFSIPDGARFVQFAYLGKEAQDDKSYNILTLPDDALIVFVQNKKYGLCLPSGKIIDANDLDAKERKLYFDAKGNIHRIWHTKEYAWLERVLSEFKPVRKVVIVKNKT